MRAPLVFTVAALSVVLIAATAAIVIVIERLVGVARAVGR